jgi:carbon storage regulator
MLRITRRAGERVIVGGEVVIEVLEVRGSTVRLGIDAPRSVSIYREELWLEVKRENEAAASAPGELPAVLGAAVPAPEIAATQPGVPDPPVPKPPPPVVPVPDAPGHEDSAGKAPTPDGE